jgi:hypothetical protein
MKNIGEAMWPTNLNQPPGASPPAGAMYFAAKWDRHTSTIAAPREASIARRRPAREWISARSTAPSRGTEFERSAIGACSMSRPGARERTENNRGRHAIVPTLNALA